jgi:hypothetical protein
MRGFFYFLQPKDFLLLSLCFPREKVQAQCYEPMYLTVVVNGKYGSQIRKMAAFTKWSILSAMFWRRLLGTACLL